MPNRRRRRRSSGSGSAAQGGEPRREQAPPLEGGGGARSTRRRRSRRGRGAGTAAGPGKAARSSEDLVRALPKARPEQLTAPPDGQTLEGIIGDLQSSYGVPQYPQEYRITIKVADAGRSERAPEPPVEEGQAVAGSERPRPRREKAPGPAREKAPSPASMAAGTEPGSEAKRRRRRGRRRRGGHDPGAGESPGGGAAEGPPEAGASE